MSRLTQLLQLHQATPGDSFLLFALAKEYETLGDDRQALGYYLRLRESDPNYVGLYYHLGKLYVKSEDLEKALEAYNTGLEVALRVNNRHAYSELLAAKMEIVEE